MTKHPFRCEPAPPPVKESDVFETDGKRELARTVRRWYLKLHPEKWVAEDDALGPQPLSFRPNSKDWEITEVIQ